MTRARLTAPSLRAQWSESASPDMGAISHASTEPAIAFGLVEEGLPSSAQTFSPASPASATNAGYPPDLSLPAPREGAAGPTKGSKGASLCRISEASADEMSAIFGLPAPHPAPRALAAATQERRGYDEIGYDGGRAARLPGGGGWGTAGLRDGGGGGGGGGGGMRAPQASAGRDQYWLLESMLSLPSFGSVGSAGGAGCEASIGSRRPMLAVRGTTVPESVQLALSRWNELRVAEGLVPVAFDFA
jgi:hypothetical protein